MTDLRRYERAVAQQISGRVEGPSARAINPTPCGSIGPAAEGTLLDLFTEDAVLVEPFTETTQTHTGKDAIRSSLKEMWKNRAPDLKLVLDRVDLDGPSVRTEWTYTSALLPGPMRGLDLLAIRSGKISRLGVVITEMLGVKP